MARTLCELKAASTSHFRMASAVTFAGDFDITFKFWTSTTGSTGVMLGDYSGGANFIAAVSSGILRIRLSSTSMDSAAGVVEPSKYYTCRATRVGTNVTLYLDGVSVVTGIKAGNFALDTIGTYNGGLAPFNGYIADVDLGTPTNSWVLGEATAGTEDSIGTGNIVTYTNIPSGQRFTFTESAGSEYWWGSNGTNLELDVQQPAANVYILAGQSNMVGQGVLVGGIDNAYNVLGGRVMPFGFDSQVRYGAINPLDHATESGGKMGLWREMCLGLPDDNIMLSPCGKNGSGFNGLDWNEGNTHYAAAVASINAGMASNSNNSMTAMIWLQGEEDAAAGRTTAQYLADLQAMRTAMITDVTGMTADTTWVVIEVGAVGAAYDEINAGLSQFASSIPSGKLIPNTGLTLLDSVHYDAASLRTLGTRVAAALEPAVVATGNNHYPPLSSGLTRPLTGKMAGGLT